DGWWCARSLVKARPSPSACPDGNNDCGQKDSGSHFRATCFKKAPEASRLRGERGGGFARSACQVSLSSQPVKSACAAAFRRGLEGQTRMIAAIGAGFAGFASAEMEVLIERIADGPFAGALAQLQQRKPARDRN